MEVALIRPFWLRDISGSDAKKCWLFVGRWVIPCENGWRRSIFEVFWWILLIIGEARQYLFYLWVNFIDVFDSGIVLSAGIGFIVSILCVFVGDDAAAAVDWAPHVVIVDNGLLHFPYLAENGLFLFAGTALVRHIIVLLIILSAIGPIGCPQAQYLFIVDFSSQTVLLQTIHSEWFLEVICSESRRRPVLTAILFSFLSTASPTHELVILAFLQALNPLSSRRSIILLLNFLDALVGLSSLQLGMAIESGEIIAFASRVGFFGRNIWKAIVFHDLKLTN